MKKNKRKQNLVTITCLVAFLVFVVAGILAFLTDTDEKINNFKIGNVDIILHEYSWMPDAYTTDDESGEPDAVQTNFGETVPKDPQVENVGKNPAYVYIKVEVPRASYEDGLTTIINESLFEYTIDDNNWTELEEARSVDETGKYNVYYYYYNNILASQEITPPLFEEITLKDNIPGVEEDILSVKVNAYAIQANGLPEGTTVENTEWAEEFKAQGVDQGVSKTMLIAVGEGSLDAYTLDIDADDTVQLVLQKPKGAQGEFEEYTFSSSNSDIATVTNNGLITGIDGGTAVVTIEGAISGTTKTITVNVTGKLTVAECDVAVANSTMATEEEQTIVITKPAGDKRKIEPVTYSSSNTSVATVDENGVITAVAKGNATITVLGLISGTSKTIDIRVKDSNILGTYVDLGTDILDRTITLSDGSYPETDWRVFNQDENGTVLILADYMPKVKLPSGVALVKNPSSNIPFGISANSYENILAGLRDEENWKSLILSNTDLYNNSDVKVKGGLTVQEWVASWNLNPGYTNITVSGDELNGYNVNGNTYVKVGSSIGVNNTLYFSHVSAFKNCYSYRLSSKCTNGKVYIVKGNYTGVLTVGFGDSGVGVRPCVFIPSSIEFDTSGDVWTIAN